MTHLTEKEEMLMDALLEKTEKILNSDELMRNVDIVRELLGLVEKEYDI